MNGYPSFYPRIVLVAPSPGGLCPVTILFIVMCALKSQWITLRFCVPLYVVIKLSLSIAQPGDENTWFSEAMFIKHQWPLLLTWFNFNPSMDK